jgi:hypothetical protein
MSELFPLNQKDVEAVAKSRINRAEGNKPTFYVVLAMIFVIGGIFVAQQIAASQWIGWAVSAVGAVIFFLYWRSLGKKQNYYKSVLLREWAEEQRRGQQQ